MHDGLPKHTSWFSWHIGTTVLCTFSRYKSAPHIDLLTPYFLLRLIEAPHLLAGSPVPRLGLSFIYRGSDLIFFQKIFYEAIWLAIATAPLH